jgi:hypothetical protein
MFFYLVNFVLLYVIKLLLYRKYHNYKYLNRFYWDLTILLWFFKYWSKWYYLAFLSKFRIERTTNIFFQILRRNEFFKMLLSFFRQFVIRKTAQKWVEWHPKFQTWPKSKTPVRRKSGKSMIRLKPDLVSRCPCYKTFWRRNLLFTVIPGNTKGGSITVPLTSYMIGLESAVWQLTIFVFICNTA